jgi:hypothetical protein
MSGICGRPNSFECLGSVLPSAVPGLIDIKAGTF